MSNNSLSRGRLITLPRSAWRAFLAQLHHDSRQVYRNLDVPCTIVEISWLAKCLVWRKLGREVTKRRGVSKCRPVLWSSSGRRVPSWFFVVESDIYCWIWCHMFVKTVRTVRLRYAFTQIVMVRSHFHCRNTVSKYWYFSETTRSFQLASHPISDNASNQDTASSTILE